MARPPLQGLKVIDMAWLMAAPECARYLADLGADVIKIESGVRRDPLRSLGNYKDGVPGPNRSLSYHAINAGKRSLTLDMKARGGREAFLRLVRWADVIIEAFTPGVADSLEVSYPHLKPLNPGLIMVSTSILGSKGPASQGLSGTGSTGLAFAGAKYLVGWPDRPPEGPNGPWTDSVTPRFITSTILSALHRRQRTGQGCFIDASQAECGIHFLMPAWFDYAVNGVSPERRGSAGSPLRAPCGVYPCAGDDRWVAIDASDAPAWSALRTIVGPALDDLRFDTLVGRLRNRDALDAAISAFTRDKSADAVEHMLQAAGAPAHVVCTAADFATDEDLQAEGYYRLINDPEIGSTMTRGPQVNFSRTPHPPVRPGPRLGDSTRDLLREVAGYSDAEIDALDAEGALR
ncbi:CoA transferase [Phenylobacterium sp.]|uniref:CaiB/BaiF CoA transferase family protein n=1 Tax=Phenylobacterium sp. TaxID=1871053 RepID=UPI00301BFD83